MSDYIRIYASAKIDHLAERGKWGTWQPICGQRLRIGQWIYCDDLPPYPGTRLCARCAALAEVAS